jgi:hypothetical protein
MDRLSDATTVKGLAKSVKILSPYFIKMKTPASKPLRIARRLAPKSAWFSASSMSDHQKPSLQHHLEPAPHHAKRAC